jgi:hypothetical protein
MKNLITMLALCAPALAQIPCFDTTFGANLNLIDESFSAPLPLGFTFTYGGTPYTDVQVCSNGYVVFGTGSPLNPDYSPTALELCNNAISRVCLMWMDFNPGAAGSGGVHANAVPANTNHPAYFTVTFNGVYRYNTTIPMTAQLRLIDGGAIECYFAGNCANNTGTWLHGASPGNGATQNPVVFTSLPIVTAGNATLHQAGIGAVPFADTVMRWTPDGTGGYTVASAPGCAAKTNYGTGCVAGYASFYEHFLVSTQIDLANTALTGVFTGNSYTIMPGITTFVAPTINALSLALGDDTQTSVTLASPLSYPGGSTSVLFVCSNGFISVGSNGTGYQPAPSTFLNWVNGTWAVWHDFICNGSNNVMFEQVGGWAYFTWNNVVSTLGLGAGTVPSTFQFQFDTTTGNFHIVFLNMDNVSISGYTGGDGYLVGWTPSGANADPGSVDLTAVLPSLILLTGADATPLRLAGSARPVLGSSVNLTVSNIPAGSPFGAVLLGFIGYNPGISLTGIGMPGCFRYTDGAASVLFIAPVGSASVPFASPASPSFIGVHVFCQGVTFSPPITPLGAIASNGVDLNLGN